MVSSSIKKSIGRQSVLCGDQLLKRAMYDPEPSGVKRALGHRVSNGVHEFLPGAVLDEKLIT